MLRLIGLLVMLSAVEVRADDAVFRIVVHQNNPIASITRAELSAIFMKRRRSWRDGREIVPVDQPAGSRVRERFSRAVHGKNVAYVTRYWQRLIFSGRGIPPRQLQNDAAVLELVKNNRDAIGYVARETPPGDGVKVIPVTP
jgi:ABC-type phosphate transport system substrate-binding protein